MGARDTVKCVDEEKDEEKGVEMAAAVYLRLVLSRVLRVRAAHDLAEAPIGNIFSQLGNYVVLWRYKGSLQVLCSADLYASDTSGVP